MDLQKARMEIDRIDTALAALLQERLEQVEEVVSYKKEKGLPVYDAKREQQICDKIESQLGNTPYTPYILDMMQEIMRVTKRFEAERMPHQLYLIGMPGAGKTTIGKMVSKVLGMEFYDLDECIEAKSGKTIQALMIHDGEQAFRRHEWEVLQELAQKKPAVIATGGGTVLSEETCQLMKKTGTIIWLRRDVKEILNDMDLEIRPLLKENIEYIFRLYEERYPLYEKISDITIDNKSDLNTVVQDTISAYRQER